MARTATANGTDRTYGEIFAELGSKVSGDAGKAIGDMARAAGGALGAIANGVNAVVFEPIKSGVSAVGKFCADGVSAAGKFCADVGRAAADGFNDVVVEPVRDGIDFVDNVCTGYADVLRSDWQDFKQAIVEPIRKDIDTFKQGYDRSAKENAEKRGKYQGVAGIDEVVAKGVKVDNGVQYGA